MFPKEHGAYGQLAFPVVAALIVAGPSTAGLLVVVAAVGGFLAHEPAAVLLRWRGSHARRERRRDATRWLLCSGLVGVAGAAGALIVVLQ
jgi:hypothetical protein